MMQWEGINYCKPKKAVFESSGKCLNINVCKETLGGLVKIQVLNWYVWGRTLDAGFQWLLLVCKLLFWVGSKEFSSGENYSDCQGREVFSSTHWTVNISESLQSFQGVPGCQQNHIGHLRKIAFQPFLGSIHRNYRKWLTLRLLLFNFLCNCMSVSMGQWCDWW